MPYTKTTKKNYGESPFEMKAKQHGNSPMQKNFGKSLAINKKLDMDNMSGGLTGQPSGETGKLGSGPMRKNSPMKKGGSLPATSGISVAKKAKGGFKPTGGMKGMTAKQAAGKRAKLRSDVKSFGKGFGSSVKQLGSQVRSGVKKVGSNIKTGKPLTSGTFMGKGGGKIKKAADAKFKGTSIKKNTKTSLNLLPKNYKLGDLSKKSTTSIPKITVPKKTKVKTHQGPPLKNYKVDHKKGLKGLTGSKRRAYYDKHKLKYDKTIKFTNF